MNAQSTMGGTLALTLMVLASIPRSGVATQDAIEERKAVHTKAGNEAIVWAEHTAELVNIGLTVREYTIVSVAMFEAANAVTQRYEPYILRLKSEGSASVDAAVATAAYQALLAVWPRERPVWDALYELSLSRVSDEAARSAGIRVGAAAADGILKLRAGDVPVPGPKDDAQSGPGLWRPVPAELTSTQAGRYAPLLDLPPVTTYLYWTPWALQRRDQFRPGPPPSINSVEYARDYDEVKRLGRFDSVQRAAEQTALALFFMAPAPRIYAPFVNQVASGRHLSVTETSRLHALLGMALTDAQIACWDAKFAYRQWRPVTAIREASDDGNVATEPDPNWIPMVPTPPFPDYPAAHACSAGAAAAVLAGFVDAGQPLTLKSPATGIPGGSGATRQYPNLAAVTTAVTEARIYAGVHFRRSSEAGAEIGAHVGRWVVQRFIRPRSNVH